MQHPSRRNFISASLGAITAFTLRPTLAATPGIRYGYAAMTWGKAEKQAIDEIAATGYEGIQLRQDALSEFQPAELRETLQQHKLTFVALSGGEVSIDPATQADQI